ncbi:hypothetical protein [Anaeromicrobium sediminis]|uniref:Uncharacterized protein n=1 Tax=Anaeromicrobium sediminis TaxID=1478221 RepID=A0A267MQG9_9FIRM|nr:hypothetical protein [Anaeromicrobium sediminis]PAB61155.1 hypothetical protein CCE28_01650 [Anaeromicrobium sediminis]
MLILLLYCIPYGSLAYKYDLETSNGMDSTGLKWMIIAFLILMFLCIKTGSKRLVIWGNIVTFLISYVCTAHMIPKWAFGCTQLLFSPYDILIINSVGLIFIQIFGGVFLIIIKGIKVGIRRILDCKLS